VQQLLLVVVLLQLLQGEGVAARSSERLASIAKTNA
jgi:hypothetical protein